MKKIVILFLSIITFSFAVDAKLEIIKKSKNLPSIVISVSNESLNDSLVKDIKKVIINDLKVSGHFKVLDVIKKSSFLEKPDMVYLKRANVDLYLNLQIQRSGFSGFILNTKLFDINSNNLVLNKSFSTKYDERYPFLAHRVAISVNKQLNAPSIDWMDKFVIFSVYKGAKKADIMIGDYTLTFQKNIIKGGLNIFPKWANNKQDSFYYTSYNNKVPTLIKMNLYSGKKEYIMKSEGMLIASDVSKDGSKLLITASPYGQADIYLYDLNTKYKKRLTSYNGIDVGAHFVNNEKGIVFVSDRLNYPNIFTKSINSRGVQRFVYHGRNNSSATTHENYVIYSSRDKVNEFGTRNFNLYLASTTSDFLRRLTSNGLNQFPKFSSDGESVLFLKTKNQRSYIGIIRLNHNKSFTFPLKGGKIQSIDW